GSKRRLEPYPCGPPGGADGTATDDEPPLAPRDRVEVADARARHHEPRSTHRHPCRGAGAEPWRPGGRGAPQQRNLFLSRSCTVRTAAQGRAAPASAGAGAAEAALHLVRRLLDGPGSLFARHELCRGEAALAWLDDRHPGHRRVSKRCRSGASGRLFAVRGAARFAGDADDAVVRGRGGASMAHSPRTAAISPLPGSQPARGAAAPRPFRHHPLPERPPLLFGRHDQGRVQAPGRGQRAGCLPDARGRGDGAGPYRRLRLRSRAARALRQEDRRSARAARQRRL
ncbi:MAG: Chemotaxis protein methyltransferase CheR, partial [uncultured Sphingosinicella sp.]